MKKIVLASTSVYRQQQLKILGLPFESKNPLIDEDFEKSKNPTLSPSELALQLAYLKASSVAREDQITIGGDQLIQLNNEILGKAGSREKAILQLQKMQGQTHELITALTVLNGFHREDILNLTKIKIKPLKRTQIESYVDLDSPWDCSGSYRMEAHGIQIVESIESTDHTAIQGIPLLGLAKILESFGFFIP